MHLQHQWWRVVVAAGLMGLVGVTAVAAAGAQFLPVLSTREGAGRAVQIPLANGYIDYVTLLNTRDGGINGVKLVWEECETVYDVPRGVECYERLKAKGPTGAGPEGDVGTSNWIRGMLRGLLTAEGIRTAMREFGNQPLTAAQVQWGLDHLSLTPASLKEMGAEGLIPPLTLSCRDHEGGGTIIDPYRCTHSCL